MEFVKDYAISTWSFVGGSVTVKKLWQIYKKCCQIGPMEDTNMEKLFHEFEQCPLLAWFHLIMSVNIHNLNYATIVKACNLHHFFDTSLKNILGTC